MITETDEAQHDYRLDDEASDEDIFSDLKRDVQVIEQKVNMKTKKLKEKYEIKFNQLKEEKASFEQTLKERIDAVDKLVE